MKLFDKSELENALFDSAVPCIKNFFEKHKDETFFGFAIEILAEEGYFHVGASSIESFRATTDYYSKSGHSMQVIEEVKWNNQEWKYFDLNYNSDIWRNLWQPTREKIDALKEYFEGLGGTESDEAGESFALVFEAAGRAAFERMMASGILENVKKLQISGHLYLSIMTYFKSIHNHSFHRIASGGR